MQNSLPPKWKGFLENVKLFAETFNNLLPIIKLAISIFGVLTIAVLINLNVNKNKNIDRYIADALRFKEEASIAIAFADSLKIEVEEKSILADLAVERSRELGSQVNALQANNRNLRERIALANQTVPTSPDLEEMNAYILSVVPLQQELISQQDFIIEIQSMQIGELEAALLLKDDVINLLTQSRDSLQVVLSNTPEIPVGNFNKFPNRKTSFIAGAVVATVTILLLR
jgi:hypothetical protein